MHKNRIYKLLIINLFLFILCIGLNVISANASVKVLNNNNLPGVSRKFLYKNESHPITHKKLDKKKRTVYLSKHKKCCSLINDAFNVKPTLSLTGVNIDFNIIFSLIFISLLGITIVIITMALINCKKKCNKCKKFYKYEKRKNRYKIKSQVNRAINIASYRIINIYERTLVNKSNKKDLLKREYLLFVQLICYLNGWSEYCLINLNIKLFNKTLGGNALTSLKKIEPILKDVNLYKNVNPKRLIYNNVDYINKLLSKLKTCDNKNHTTYDYAFNVLLKLVKRNIRYNTNSINSRALKKYSNLGYIDVYRDFLLKKARF